MDASRFDRLARVLVATSPRRRLLAWGASGVLGLAGLGGGERVWGKKKRKKKCKACGPCRTCVKGKCKPKLVGTSCGAGQQCFADGTCNACDVCLGDCAFTSLQDAVTAANMGATIRVCPGRYPTNAVFTKDVSLIGAGSGAGGTILDGQDRGSVLDITGLIEMRGFTITGGQAVNGAGIKAYRVTLRLEDVLLSDHQSSGPGGAINSDRSQITLINTRITGSSAERGGGIYNGLSSVLTLRSNSAITGNTASGSGGGPDDPVAGGIHNAGASVQLLDGSSVTGNTPVNCVGTPAC